jgi:hypothetical protein
MVEAKAWTASTCCEWLRLGAGFFLNMMECYGADEVQRMGDMKTLAD